MNHYTKYHKILGVQVGDSIDKIKKAYRKKALKYHPDVNRSPEAHQKFLEITTAYEVLTGQKRITYRKKPKPKTREEIIAEKIKIAKERYERMMAEEELRDTHYFNKIATGWKWSFFRIGAIYGLLMALLLTVDYFSVGERKTILASDVAFDRYNKTLYVENEKFDIPNPAFWHTDMISIRGNYSWFFHDLKSVSVVVSPMDQWIEGKHSYRMRDLADFEDFRLETYISSASIYTVFPFVHFFLLIPFLLVLMKKPRLWFSVWWLVSVYAIFPLLFILSISNERILSLIEAAL